MPNAGDTGSTLVEAGFTCQRATKPVSPVMEPKLWSLCSVAEEATAVLNATGESPRAAAKALRSQVNKHLLKRTNTAHQTDIKMKVS